MNKLKTIGLLLFVLFSAAGIGAAQADCPTVEIIGASSLKRDNIINAVVKGGTTSVRPKFLWKVSGAEKVADDASDMLFVRVLKTKVGDPVSITVDVVGYAPSCRVTKTVTVKNTVAPFVCDTLNIVGPATVTTGETADLKLAITGGDSDKSDLTYYWTISDATIESGQGTANIKVYTTDSEGKSVTANVSINNLGDGCANTKAFTFNVVKKAAPAPAAKPKKVTTKKPVKSKKV